MDIPCLILFILGDSLQPIGIEYREYDRWSSWTPKDTSFVCVRACFIEKLHPRPLPPMAISQGPRRLSNKDQVSLLACTKEGRGDSLT